MNKTMPIQVRIKYLLDRILSVPIVVLLAPVLAGIALAIRIFDGGPVLFRQPRPGLDGKMFDVFKFRTMIVDADRFLDANGRPTSGSRVTGIGRTLRRLSLDELPQIFNILRGEMSFIGPRPISTEHLPRLTDWQRGRFRMNPGITGLAQVNGRNTLKWSKRIEFDNDYIDNYSLQRDVAILFRTVRTVVLQEGIVMDRNPQDVNDLGPAQPQQELRKAA